MGAVKMNRRPSDTELREMAKRRVAQHAGAPSSRHWGDPVECEFIGLVGERAFSDRFGMPMNLADQPMGDGKFDFVVNGWKIDVKTAKKPTYLLVAPRKCSAKSMAA